jgi:hypothetical protein
MVRVISIDYDFGGKISVLSTVRVNVLSSFWLMVKKPLPLRSKVISMGSSFGSIALGEV